MVLQAKGLSYRTVDVTPGIGQVAVFRMSGQRQVPVLVDGDVVLADPIPVPQIWRIFCPFIFFDQNNKKTLFSVKPVKKLSNSALN